MLRALALVAAGAIACGHHHAIGAPDASLADAAGADVRSDAGSSAHADAGPGALNVLFIGNSYTYTNDLPGMLAQIASTSGQPPSIMTAEVIQGSATLGILWDLGTPVTEIAAHRWTHVVLQGQSEEPLFGSADFDTYAEDFESLISAVGARPTLFVTWARAAGDPIYSQQGGSFACPAQMQDELTVAYASLTQQSPDDLLVCAGEAFQLAIQQYPEIALQQSDLSHPTVAGTYLAACTFYVALTGHPVPEQSAVPAGVSAEDAAHLREIAQVGSNCAGIQVKGAVQWYPDIEINLGRYDGVPDAGPGDAGPPDGGWFDFGTAGVPVTNYFALSNLGPTAAGVADGLTLAPPFSWSGDGGYPGGSGVVEIDGYDSLPFCSSTIAPLNDAGYATDCVVAVTYSGAATDTGLLILNLTGDYSADIEIRLKGTATPRALVTISDDPGFFGCSDSTCGPAQSSCGSLSLIVTNRGGAPTTSLGGGPLGPGAQWGFGPDAGTFPGGTGMGSINGQSYEYCTSGALAPGQQCLISVSGIYEGAVSLAYADAMGPLTPNASRNVTGICLPP